ncbi:hypothetical protein M0812_01915 [Anaeramoeba flamelloides]|uniref:PAS domain-containing protein n=1 Tax=Anaeramoeba flamelloides TaxID=1746091 RepID=A0AAV7Z1D4_9EUKA|nr:hypothetical protein M0812_01915 [Anaeramoeba flamelloides]
MGNTNSIHIIKKKTNDTLYGLKKNTPKSFCVCKSSDSTIFYASNNFQNLFQMEKSDLYGKSINISPFFQPHLGIQSQEAFVQIKTLLLRSSGYFTFDWLFKKKNNELFWAKAQVYVANLENEQVFRVILTEIPNPTTQTSEPKGNDSKKIRVSGIDCLFTSQKTKSYKHFSKQL